MLLRVTGFLLFFSVFNFAQAQQSEQDQIAYQLMGGALSIEVLDVYTETDIRGVQWRQDILGIRFSGQTADELVRRMNQNNVRTDVISCLDGVCNLDPSMLSSTVKIFTDENTIQAARVKRHEFTGAGFETKTFIGGSEKHFLNYILPKPLGEIFVDMGLCTRSISFCGDGGNCVGGVSKTLPCSYREDRSAFN